MGDADKAAGRLMATAIAQLRTERDVSAAQAMELMEHAPAFAKAREGRDGCVATIEDMLSAARGALQ